MVPLRPLHPLRAALPCLAALLLFAPPAPALEATVHSAAPPRVTLPVKLRYGVPAIACTLNGAAASIIIDTGSQISLLSAETARRVGVQPRDLPAARMILTGSHGRENARLARLDRFTAGPWQVRGLPVVVRERSSDFAARGRERVLIDVLSGRVLAGTCAYATFDPATGTVTFGFGEKFRARSGDVSSVAFKVEGGLPYADATVDGARVRCLIDTGTSAALELNPADTAAARLEPRSHGASRRRIGIGERGSAASVIRSDRAARIDFGGVQLREAEVLAVADRSKLGFGFLKHFRTTFDFRRNRIWFEPR